MGDSFKLVVGSRKSELALIQTNHMIKELKRHHSSLECGVVTMQTLGDEVLDVALPKMGDKSLFTKTLEIALAEERVDCLVHSLKDLPTLMIPGMAIGAIYKRDSKFDAVIFHPKHGASSLEDLPSGSVIGTSSLRRIAQLQGKFPSLKFESVRGNLNTRLKKLDEDNKYDALVLAEAGIVRMNWQERIGQVLGGDCLYAVGQGALAVEVRADDPTAIMLVGQLSDFDTLISCVAERAFLNALDGGCSVPIGVSTDYKGNQLDICGSVYSLDGSTSLTHQLSVTIATPASSDQFVVTPSGVMVRSTWLDAALKADKVGREIATKLREDGADRLLEEARAVIGSQDISKPTSI